MKYQFIKGVTKDDRLLLHTRSETDKRQKVIVKDFHPYVYVPETVYWHDYHVTKRESGYEGIYGTRLKKLIVKNQKNPSKVAERDS